ncbi:hypothetical protein [Thalassospira sp. HJ]|uniref:hypothetical protein n=1 Tax=Thalassospira sp. HJ TaxID=1616823 RepID=UPI0005CE50E4|nr:hypothetical protein [Thalassospira sp. HJ]
MKKPFDLFGEYAKFGVEQKVSLHDPSTKSAFSAHVEKAIEQGLQDDILLYGQRVEAMFMSTLVSLGEFKLLKHEDVGRVFPEESYIAPDIRVVLKDGRQWLVEVKNVFEREHGNKKRRLMTASYFNRLNAYSQETGAELKLAIYWAKWRIWTVISPDKLLNESGDLKLSMCDALLVNEFSELGDRQIGTRSPLRLRVLVDQSKPSNINEHDQASFTIGGVKLFSEDREILDANEQEVALTLMFYGDWLEKPPTAVMENDELIAVEYESYAGEPPQYGLNTIGTLSSIFSRYYTEKTVADNKVVQLLAVQRPNWLNPLVSKEYKSGQLPIWQFVQQPNFDALDKRS